MQLSTDVVTERRKVEYWSEIVCRTFCEAAFDATGEHQGFHGSIDFDDCGPIRIGRIHASPQRVLRTPASIARSDCALYFLILQLKGLGYHQQAGRGGCLQPGDFAILDTARPYDLRFTEAFSQLVLTLPQEWVTAQLPDAQRLTACTVMGRSGAGRVASVFIRQMASQLASTRASSLPYLQAGLAALLAAGLGEQRQVDVAQSATKHALTQRVLQYIESHLQDSELTCGAIATQHRISERYLRLLFDELGECPSDWIWRRRLERARQDLVDPANRNLPIASVCFTWGFKDAAHFSRAFKARFGCTPGEARTRAIRN